MGFLVATDIFFRKVKEMQPHVMSRNCDYTNILMAVEINMI